MNEYLAFSKPEQFPTERLQEERLALVRCINDASAKTCTGKLLPPLERGRYYTAVSFWHDFSGKSISEVELTDENGRTGPLYPADRFEIINDPCGLASISHVKAYRLWKKARFAHVDKSNNIVDDYLKKNRLALLLYCDDDFWQFKSGQQYYAVSHCTDGYEILMDTYDGKRIFGYPSSCFDILSDPLGLLDWNEKTQKENDAVMKALHPEYFEKIREPIRWPSGRTDHEDTIYEDVKKRLSTQPDELSKEAFLSIPDQSLQENLF